MADSNILNLEFLKKLQRKAKLLKFAHPSISHSKYLNILAIEYGFKSYHELRNSIAKRAELELNQQENQEEQLWKNRFAPPLIWGMDENIESTVCIPWLNHFKNNIPFPVYFINSNLFTGHSGTRRQVEGPVFSVSGVDLIFHGDELRLDDRIILTDLIRLSKSISLGEAVEFCVADIIKMSPTLMGEPVTIDKIKQTCWRLAHGKLAVPIAKFDGTMLVFCDFQDEPDRIVVRFNPKFINLFVPPLPHLLF